MTTDAMRARDTLAGMMCVSESGVARLPLVDDFAEAIGTDVDSADETMGSVLDRMVEDGTLTFDGCEYYDTETLEAIEDSYDDGDWEFDERQSFHINVWGRP